MNQNQVINESFLQLGEIEGKELEVAEGLRGTKSILGKIIKDLEEWGVGHPLPYIYVDQVKVELLLLLKSVQRDISVMEENKEEINKLTSIIQRHQEEG